MQSLKLGSLVHLSGRSRIFALILIWAERVVILTSPPHTTAHLVMLMKKYRSVERLQLLHDMQALDMSGIIVG
ncbi:unnamed protein product, partial [Allacma fusca]